jgi:hypothetical protein
MVAGGQQKRLTHGKRCLLRSVRSKTLRDGPDTLKPSATTTAVPREK